MEDTIVLLNVLLKKNYDVLKEYKRVAESVKGSELSKFYNQKVNERYVFGNQLKAEIKKLNGPLLEQEDLGKYLPLKWSIFQSGRTNAVNLLKACEKGEKNCLREYEECLRIQQLPKSTKSLLQSHYNQISGTLWNLQFKILDSKIEQFTSMMVSKPAVFSV